MATVSLKSRIQRYLEVQKEWIPKEQIIQVARQAYENEGKGLNSDQVARRLREMAEDGEVQVEYYQGKGKGKVKLAKYSALKVEKEIKPQLQVSIVEINGIIKAVEI